MQAIDIKAQHNSRVSLPQRVYKRGWFVMSQPVIASCYPFGLFRASFSIGAPMDISDTFTRLITLQTIKIILTFLAITLHILPAIIFWKWTFLITGARVN
jgi:hypothetical protein